MSKQQWHILVSKTHKWFGLILGIQLLFWLLGGVVMSWIPIEEVRGQHKVAEQAPVVLPANSPLQSAAQLIATSNNEVLEVRYYSLLGKSVAKLTFLDGNTAIHDALTGEKLTPVSAEVAKEIALSDYALSAPILSIEEITEPSIDYRRAFPVWKITFDDAENTSLYVSPEEARVVARRSSVWRFYDFFWMLHIMDYDERHDFNNPLIMTTSLFAVLFAISGFVLLYFRFHRRDFKFILGKAK